jgi:hypothetical protein
VTAKLEPCIFGPYECEGTFVDVDHQVHADFADFIAMHAEIRDLINNQQLQNDLIEHL